MYAATASSAGKIPHAQLNPLFCSGSVRILFPVAANTAFTTAGKIGGSVGSPKPVGAKFVLIQNTSMGGTCFILINGC